MLVELPTTSQAAAIALLRANARGTDLAATEPRDDFSGLLSGGEVRPPLLARLARPIVLASISQTKARSANF